MRIYNMTSNTIIQKQIQNSITGIELMYPYVITITNNTLEQYDYSTGIVLLISNISHALPTFVYRLFRLRNDTLVVSRDFLISPYVYPTIYYFAITPCYTCTLSTPCSSLYTLSLNGNSCCKNVSTPIIKPHPSEQQSMLDQNSIASTFDASDGSQHGEMVLKSISSVFVVSSFKLTPQFLLALITVIDDISYYQYHLKSYPNSVEFFTTNLDIINSAKLNISIIQFLQKIKAKTSIATKQNEHLINYLNISTLADEDIYFQRSFVQNYRNCILINLFVFCLLNAVTFAIYALSLKFKGLKGVFVFFRKNSKWWIFISSFMETTFSRGCFDFGVQFLLASSENFKQKLNISACFSLLFLIITYACNFYPLLFSFSNKKSAKLISIPSKMNTFSYLSISHFILLRTLSRTLVHSTFLTSYTKQIFSLFFIDIIVILLCIRFRHSFYNLLIFTFYLTQMIAFCAFDLFFFLQQIEMLPTNHRRQLVSLILILVILFSSILISFVLFATSLKSICATIIKKIKNMKIKNIDIAPKQRDRQEKTTKQNKKATIEIKSEKKTSVVKIKPKIIKETIGQKQNRVIFKIKENRVKEKQKGKIKKVRCNLQLNLQKMIRQH